MLELTRALRHRTHEAITALDEARAQDDLHLASIRLGELDSLARTAAEHELDVPELSVYRRAG